MKLLIASKNAHKIREMRALLKPLRRFDLYSLLDFPDYQPVEESGNSFEENATLKATSAATALHIWTIADDSGLVVPALNGSPGIYSARYNGACSSDKDNRKKLLKEMQDLKGERRNAYFECAIALASPQKLKKCVLGRCEGVIIESERGGKGFGYDPLFLKHDYNFTFAELEENIKNQISHRAKAFEKILPFLESLAEPLQPTYS